MNYVIYLIHLIFLYKSILVISTPINSRRCGEPYYPISQNGLRIIGGGPAAPNSHPWQIFLTDSRNRLNCGGSLIGSSWVLTAAHCLKSHFTGFKVYLGSHDLSRNEISRQIVSVDKFILHERYNKYGLLENDIALIKLSRPVEYTREIIPICLPFARPAINTVGIATGWGLTRNLDRSSLSKLLNQVSITVKDENFCDELGVDLERSQICAGNSIQPNGLVRDTCLGDSGGPLITRNGTKYFLTGIVSYGGEICNGVGVYTNVASYLDWIERKIYEEDRVEIWKAW